jgi:hypothetical protein
MATYTVTIADDKVATFEAFCAAKGATVDDFLQRNLDGHVDYAAKLAAQNDQVALAAKAAQAEAWEPTMTKYDKLEKEKKDQVDAILASVAAVEEPIGG